MELQLGTTILIAFKTCRTTVELQRHAVVVVREASSFPVCLTQGPACQRHLSELYLKAVRVAQQVFKTALPEIIWQSRITCRSKLYQIRRTGTVLRPGYRPCAVRIANILIRLQIVDERNVVALNAARW